MSKLAILAEEMYQELELWYPLLRLKEAGHGVTTLGAGKPSYKSKLGYEVKVDADIKEVKASEFDGVIIPGGYAPDYMRRHEAMVKLVADLFKKGKLVGAICHGLWVPVSAGILKGRKCTCFFSIKDDVVNAGAKYVDEEVVVDRNLITSRVPTDLPAFMREVIKFLH
jgi:protease I